MTITASMVKELRARTSVGMMDCKAALTETGGDMDKAIEFLRMKGLAKAAKRADHATTAGKVAKCVEGNIISLLELNCETDFVAKNDDFNVIADALVRQISSSNPDDLDALSALPYIEDTSKTVADVMAEAVAKIGESLKIGRFVRMEPTSDPGMLSNYMHTGNTIGVIVDFAVSKPETIDAETFRTMAYDVAMHVAASAPAYLSPEEVPAEVVDKEKEIYMAEARESGKPENILEKIATGKLNKFYKDNCLVNQEFVKDADFTIEGLMKKISDEVGDAISITRFTRIKIGEGE